MDGVFVTAVDTGIGKTVVSAGLVKMMLGAKKVCYWKPVQTGTIVGDDTREVMDLASLTQDLVIPPAHSYPDPLSPYIAAKKWGKTIVVSDLLKSFQTGVAKFDFAVVEGAGGLLVPFSATELQVDFMKSMKLPLLIITEDRVGAINQTLLTLERARAEKLDILGVIITRARGQFGNAECISHFGKVEILAEFPPSEDTRTIVAQVATHDRLRKIFHLPSLPNVPL